MGRLREPWEHEGEIQRKKQLTGQRGGKAEAQLDIYRGKIRTRERLMEARSVASHLWPLRAERWCDLNPGGCRGSQ